MNRNAYSCSADSRLRLAVVGSAVIDFSGQALFALFCGSVVIINYYIYLCTKLLLRLKNKRYSLSYEAFQSRSQFVTLNEDDENLKSQYATSRVKRGRILSICHSCLPSRA